MRKGFLEIMKNFKKILKTCSTGNVDYENMTICDALLVNPFTAGNTSVCVVEDLSMFNISQCI